MFSGVQGVECKGTGRPAQPSARSGKAHLNGRNRHCMCPQRPQRPVRVRGSASLEGSVAKALCRSEGFSQSPRITPALKLTADIVHVHHTPPWAARRSVHGVQQGRDAGVLHVGAMGAARDADTDAARAP